MKGIDVSHHNTVDWEAAKQAGLKFAMLRCGYGSDLKELVTALESHGAPTCIAMR